jgi:hypothetical protein
VGESSLLLDRQVGDGSAQRLLRHGRQVGAVEEAEETEIGEAAQCLQALVHQVVAEAEVEVERAVRVLSVCRPSLVMLRQKARLSLVSAVRQLTATVTAVEAVEGVWRVPLLSRQQTVAAVEAVEGVWRVPLLSRQQTVAAVEAVEGGWRVPPLSRQQAVAAVEAAEGGWRVPPLSRQQAVAAVEAVERRWCVPRIWCSKQ